MISSESVKAKGIVIVSAGGLNYGGGIGSMTRLIKSWTAIHRPQLRVDVIDARGERRGGAAWSLVRVPLGIVQLIYIRIAHRSNILHLQVSERLSFPRKGIFFAFGRLLGMRVVLHYHGADLRGSYDSSSGGMRRLMQKMARDADVNIVLGEVWRDFLISRLGAPAGSVVVFYNAGKDLGSQSTPRPINLWKFLIVANLLPRKGISDLLKAVSHLAAQGAPISLTLAGGGQITHYQAEAKSLGIDSICDFTGWIQGDALYRLFHTHSALILPSYLEGLPIAIIEALGAGLPVIATPVGSIPEVLIDGRDCLYIEPGNEQDIIRALTRMATDVALRESIRANGRRLYESHFGVENYMQRMALLYDSLV